MSVAPVNADHAISGVVKQLMFWKRETHATLADVLGCSSVTVGRKLRGDRPWDAADVALLAEHYNVSPNTLFSGVEALFRNGITWGEGNVRSSSPDDGVSFPVAA